MKKLILLSSLLFSLSLNAQNYEQHIEKAKRFLATKQYKEAAAAYSAAFIAYGNKGQLEDRIQAAIAYGNIQNADSVWFMLNRVATRINYDDYPFVENEPAFTFMKADTRWAELYALIHKNGATINWELRRELEKILKDDQMVRGKNNNTSGLSQHDMDFQNLAKIEAILQKYGWLGEDIVGEKGNNAIFAVIQHSELGTQLKYLPMLREAVKNKNAQPHQLAMMEDRTNMFQGKKQIYGSQLKTGSDGKWFVWNIEDPQNVDKRRAEIGLRPMAEYVKNFSLVWDLEAHIKEQEATKKD